MASNRVCPDVLGLMLPEAFTTSRCWPGFLDIVVQDHMGIQGWGALVYKAIKSTIRIDKYYLENLEITSTKRGSLAKTLETWDQGKGLQSSHYDQKIPSRNLQKHISSLSNQSSSYAHF